MLVPGGQYAGPILMQGGATEIGNGDVVECIVNDNGAYTVLSAQATLNGNEITWEASQDGTTWAAVQFTPLSSGTAVSQTTTDGIYRATVLGLRYVRARISSYESGTVTVLAWLVA